MARLDEDAILLTPHLLEPLGADRELNILISGVYNLGFLGVADRAPARRFLAWWEERLATDCRHAIEEGLHWEQRWADLVPSLFEDVGVLRDERVNVGHWNLPERSVEDCRLFRFSGYEPDAPGRATRYADRLATGALNGASEHFARYRAALLAAGWDEARDWPYAFDRFADGAPIPPVARLLHDELGGERFADPFAVGAGSFAAWLREPVDERWPALSRLWLELHERRDDLRAAFADPLGADRREFARWARETGAAEHGLPATLDVRESRRGERAVVTIVGRNRLPAARVLAASLREHQPGVALHVVLADAVGAQPAAGDEPFVLHPLCELDVPGLAERGLRSTPLELLRPPQAARARGAPRRGLRRRAVPRSRPVGARRPRAALGRDRAQRDRAHAPLVAPPAGRTPPRASACCCAPGPTTPVRSASATAPRRAACSRGGASGSTRPTTAASTRAPTTTNAGSTSSRRCSRASPSCATSASTSATGTSPSATAPTCGCCTPAASTRRARSA